MRRPGQLRITLLVAAAFLVLTCAYTWPLALNLRGAVPHDRGDPLLVTWILWWSTKAMPLTERWWNAPAFYPATGVFAFSENLLSLAPITAPLIAIGKAPILAYNTAFILSYVLSGVSAYLLALVLTSRHDAALVAGAAFAFAPYRLSHTNHLQLLSSYWMPIALAALHVFARTGRKRAASLFAVAWGMQSLASGYYLVFLSVLVLLWLAWFAPPRRQIVVLAVCWFAAAVVLAPLLVGYRTIHAKYGLKRSPVEMVYYSADVAGVLSASADSLVWRRVHAVDRAESELFPGVTAAILFACGVVAVVRRRPAATGSEKSDASRALLFYLGTAILMWTLALGPRPAFLGKPIGIPGPYALLMHLPGFDEMRVPARLWMLTVLCSSIVAALVIARLPAGRGRRIAVTLSIVGLLLDGWPGSLAVVAAPDLRPPSGHRAVARLGLPLARNETEAMYQTIGDGLPVFNGYSGYEAPHHAPLRDLLDRHDGAILDRLAADGPIQVVVEHVFDPDREWRGFVERSGARLLDSTADWSRYELAQRPRPAVAVPSGTLLRVQRADANVNAADVDAMFDGDLNTRWHAGQQRGRESVTIDLGATHRVGWVVPCLGTYASQYPRSLIVETSVDGASWSAAWSGRTALATYDAAVADPRSVPIAFPVGREARMIRLRQTADEPTRPWTIVELRIFE